MVKFLFFVPNLLIFEPYLRVFACQLRAQIVPFSSLKRACFELSWCRFWVEIVPVLSRNRADFEPEPCIFQVLFVLLSSTFVLCPFKHWLLMTCCAAKLGDFLQQISFSKHRDIIRTKQSSKSFKGDKRDFLKDRIRKRYDEVKHI